MNRPIVESSQVSMVRNNPFYRTDLIVHGCLFAGGLAVVLMSIFMSVEGQHRVFLPGSSVPLPQSCTAKIFFGVDCPGCGLTRSCISIGHGQFDRAWHFNPAGFLVYLLIAAQIPWQLMQLRRIVKGQRIYDRPWIFVLPIAAAVALIAQWIVKLCL